VRVKGINYDVGTHPAANRPSRPTFDEAVARDEIATIARELGCTAIRITGEDPQRLRVAAEFALAEGLTVYLTPARHNAQRTEALAYLDDIAPLAESLRVEAATGQRGDVVFVVGVEATLFQRGFLRGDTPFARIGTLMRPWSLAWSTVRLGSMHKLLNAYLREAVATVRKHFGGPVTYAAGPWEEVDWAPFDIVGIDFYRDARSRPKYRQRLRGYASHGKPVVVTEFGCCTYTGAADKGGYGWAIVDFTAKPPRLTRAVTRDEQAQADELTDLLRVYDEAAVDGAFVFTWAMYTYPWGSDPEHDLDVASYGVVAVQPDGGWRRKAAFDAVAAAYRRATV
jgi:hypothetical protein